MKKILPFFSYLFHPIFIPLMATLFYLYCNELQFTIEEKRFVFLQVLVITGLIPSLFFVLLRYFGKVDSIMVAEVAQRKIPLVIQCFLLILLVKKSIVIERYPELHFFFLAALLSTLFALIASLFNIKASLHMLALSALTVFIIGMSQHYQIHNDYFAAFLVLMNGFVASSRLEMNAHTPKELLLGLLLGTVPQFVLMYLWL